MGTLSRKVGFAGGLFGVLQTILSLSCDSLGSCFFQFDLSSQPDYFFVHAAERRRWRLTV